MVERDRRAAGGADVGRVQMTNSGILSQRAAGLPDEGRIGPSPISRNRERQAAPMCGRHRPAGRQIANPMSNATHANMPPQPKWSCSSADATADSHSWATHGACGILAEKRSRDPALWCAKNPLADRKMEIKVLGRKDNDRIRNRYAKKQPRQRQPNGPHRGSERVADWPTKPKLAEDNAA